MTMRLHRVGMTRCAIALLIGIGVSMGARSASAAACDPYLGHVDHSTACQLGTSNYSNASNMNADLIFGVDSWVRLVRNTTGADTSGTFTDIPPDLWTTQGYKQAILVLKGGNSTSPGVYIAYRLVFGTTGDVDWTTPFTKNGNPQNVINRSLYATTIAATPIPAALPLFGSGLAFLGWASRRRTARVSSQKDVKS
jgi:hypothetical protein